MAALDPALEAGVREIVAPLLTEYGVPGATVAAVVDGETVIQTGVGTADLGGASPLDPDAQFYIYSITKTLTAIATLQLAEQGRLRLDSPVQELLLDLALAGPVTIRQLLNHTGGVPDYGGTPEYHDAVRATPERPWTTAEFLECTLPAGPAFAAGQGWAYSNIGYLILKLLLEEVHGRPFRTILQEVVFAPLGLQRTYVAGSLDDAVVLTPGYSSYFAPGDEPADMTSRYHPGWVSHGVVISTALEIAEVIEALFDGRLLSASSLEEMLESVHVPDSHPQFNQPAYGLGLMVDAGSRHGTVAGHGGGGPGYSTGAIHLSSLNGHRVTGVALANSDCEDLGLRIVFAVAERVTASSA